MKTPSPIAQWGPPGPPYGQLVNPFPNTMPDHPLAEPDWTYAPLWKHFAAVSPALAAFVEAACKLAGCEVAIKASPHAPTLARPRLHHPSYVWRIHDPRFGGGVQWVADLSGGSEEFFCKRIAEAVDDATAEKEWYIAHNRPLPSRPSPIANQHQVGVGITHGNIAGALQQYAVNANQQGQAMCGGLAAQHVYQQLETSQ
jgi:hypothetical protein